MKTRRTIQIPPASLATPRLKRRGKHQLGLHKPGRIKEIQNRAIAKEQFLRSSSQAAKEIAAQRADARTYRAFYDSLSPEDQRFARLHGLHRPPTSAPSAHSGDALDHRDEAADIPHISADRGCLNGRPLGDRTAHETIDALEPERLSVELAQLSDSEIAETSATVEHALRWALDGAGLVDTGKRACVIIAAMRRDLAGGLVLEPALAREFIRSLEYETRSAQRCAVGSLLAAGRVFDRFLEWMRRGSSLSAIGERLQLVAYILRPDLIDAATLAALGAETNKTRQAKDKGANCFRDTFASLKALAMRPEITRLRCQAAHA